MRRCVSKTGVQRPMMRERLVGPPSLLGRMNPVQPVFIDCGVMKSIAALLLATSLVSIVMGCGSDEPAVPPVADEWATAYCTAIESLATPVIQAASTVTKANVATPAQAQDALAPVGTAATAFARDMAALPPTGTTGAAEVKQQTDQLANTVDKYVGQARASLKLWEAGTGSQEATLSLVGSQLRAIRQGLGSATAAIRNVDTTISAAIDDSASCQSVLATISPD